MAEDEQPEDFAARRARERADRRAQEARTAPDGTCSRQECVPDQADHSGESAGRAPPAPGGLKVARQRWPALLVTLGLILAAALPYARTCGATSWAMISVWSACSPTSQRSHVLTLFTNP